MHRRMRVERARRVQRLFNAGFWLGLLLLHGAGIAYAALGVASGTVPTFDGVIRIALLLASSLFFALKIAGADCVRLTPGWRSALAATLAVALIHLGAARRAVRGDASLKPASLGMVLALGAAGQAALVRRWVLEAGRAWAGAAAGAKRVGLGASSLRFASLAPAPSAQLVHLMSVRTLRAPPA